MQEKYQNLHDQRCHLNNSFTNTIPENNSTQTSRKNIQNNNFNMNNPVYNTVNRSINSLVKFDNMSLNNDPEEALKNFKKNEKNREI